MEKLIYSSKVLSYNWPDEDDRHGKIGREIESDCYKDFKMNGKIGDRIVTYAGAPGCGRWVYEVTRIDESGVYGIEIECSVRILDPWEVV